MRPFNSHETAMSVQIWHECEQSNTITGSLRTHSSTLCILMTQTLTAEESGVAAGVTPGLRCSIAFKVGVHGPD